MSQTPKRVPANKAITRASANEGMVKVIIGKEKYAKNYFYQGNTLVQIIATPTATPIKKAIKKISIVAGVVNVIIIKNEDISSIL